MNKCKICKYGGNYKISSNLIYNFKEIIKEKNGKIIHINYLNNEHGCRNTSRNNIENICIRNNFSKFKK